MSYKYFSIFSGFDLKDDLDEEEDKEEEEEEEDEDEEDEDSFPTEEEEEEQDIEKELDEEEEPELEEEPEHDLDFDEELELEDGLEIEFDGPLDIENIIKRVKKQKLPELEYDQLRDVAQYTPLAAVQEEQKPVEKKTANAPQVEAFKGNHGDKSKQQSNSEDQSRREAQQRDRRRQRVEIILPQYNMYRCVAATQPFKIGIEASRNTGTALKTVAAISILTIAAAAIAANASTIKGQQAGPQSMGAMPSYMPASAQYQPDMTVKPVAVSVTMTITRSLVEITTTVIS